MARQAYSRLGETLVFGVLISVEIGVHQSGSFSQILFCGVQGLVVEKKGSDLGTSKPDNCFFLFFADNVVPLVSPGHVFQHAQLTVQWLGWKSSPLTLRPGVLTAER